MSTSRIRKAVKIIIGETTVGGAFGLMTAGVFVTGLTALGPLSRHATNHYYTVHTEGDKIVEGFAIGSFLLGITCCAGGLGYGFIQGLKKVCGSEEDAFVEEKKIDAATMQPLKIIYEFPASHVHPASLTSKEEKVIDARQLSFERKEGKATEARPASFESKEEKVIDVRSLSLESKEEKITDAHPAFKNDLIRNDNSFFTSVRRFENCRQDDDVLIKDFICPISCQIMNEPVSVKGYPHHKYEREALERWFVEEKKRTIPMSNVTLLGDTVTLIPDFLLQIKINMYLKGLESRADEQRKLPKSLQTHKRSASR